MVSIITYIFYISIQGRLQVVKEEMLSRVENSNAKVRGLKRKRKKKTNEFKNYLSQNVFKRKMRKILEYGKSRRDIARQAQEMDKEKVWKAQG
jgi:hypothetical protein